MAEAVNRNVLECRFELKTNIKHELNLYLSQFLTKFVNTIYKRKVIHDYGTTITETLKYYS